MDKLDEVLTVIRGVRQHVLLHSDHYTAGVRATGLVSVTFLLAYFSSDLLLMSARVSPILTIQLTMACSGGLLLTWRKLSHDINLTLFRLLKLSLRVGCSFWSNNLAVQSSSADPETVKRGYERRKSVRLVVVFLMMWQCIQPQMPLVLVLAFVVYVICGDRLKFTSDELLGFISSLPMIDTLFESDASDSDVEITSDESTEKTSPTVTSAPNIKSHFSNFGFRKTLDLIKMHVTWGRLFVMAKVVVSFYWMLMLMWYSPALTVCMYSYISITRPWVELHLISVLLKIEMEGGLLECAEGLEQYYIAGGLAVVEVTVTLVLMVWSLYTGSYLLMLVALYTNLFSSGHDAFRFIITPAVYERAFLAKFEKVSGEVLVEAEMSCAICLGTMGIARKTQCGHLFHGHCLRKLVSHGRRICPMCRKPLFS